MQCVRWAPVVELNLNWPDKTQTLLVAKWQQTGVGSWVQSGAIRVGRVGGRRLPNMRPDQAGWGCKGGHSSYTRLCWAWWLAGCLSKHHGRRKTSSCCGGNIEPAPQRQSRFRKGSSRWNNRWYPRITQLKTEKYKSRVFIMVERRTKGQHQEISPSSEPAQLEIWVTFVATGSLLLTPSLGLFKPLFWPALASFYVPNNEVLILVTKLGLFAEPLQYVLNDTHDCPPPF